MKDINQERDSGNKDRDRDRDGDKDKKKTGLKDQKKGKAKKKNRPPLYGKGRRRELVRLMLTCGVIPQKGICMFDANKYLSARKLKDMEREGVVRQIRMGKKPVMQAYIFNKFEEMSRKFRQDFPSRLFSHYARYAKESGYAASQTSSRHRAVRAYRQGLACCIMHGAGVRTLADEKPEMDAGGMISLETGAPYYYLADEVKAVGGNADVMEGAGYRATEIRDERTGEIKAKSSSRALGTVFAKDGMYVIYHTDHTHIAWTTRVERQFFIYCQRVCFRKFGGMDEGGIQKRRMIVFYSLDRVGRQILYGTRSGCLSYESGYTETFLIPYTPEGRTLFALMAEGNYIKRMSAFLLPEARTDIKRRTVECDAYDGDVNYLLFVSPDITKLHKFAMAARMAKNSSNFVVICYDFQTDLLRGMMDGNVTVYEVGMEECLKELGRKSGPACTRQ